MVRSVRAALRTVVLAVRGFFRDEGFQQASALAFDSVISILPLLVIAFATLRGLGAYDAFINSSLRPWIEHTFGPAASDRSTLREAVVRLFELGEGVNLAALGFIGIILLLYLVVVLLATTESTLNRIWGVHRPRRLVRKAADYAAILFVIPFAMSFAATAGQAVAKASWLHPVARVIDVVSTVGAASLVTTFFYLVMPHTSVRFRSAIRGGVTAGLLWTGVLWAYTTFQIGVARYNALYSSFAAIPLFLVFVFVSWCIVLFGAELAAAHQNPRGFRWRIPPRRPELGHPPAALPPLRPRDHPRVLGRRLPADPPAAHQARRRARDPGPRPPRRADAGGHRGPSPRERPRGLRPGPGFRRACA